MAVTGAILSVVAPASAGAATFNVTPGSGDPDPAPGCQPAACSLREAVIAASAAPGSTVNVPAGHFVLSRSDSGGSDSATTGDLSLEAAMTIVGAGAGSTTVDANGIDRVFDVTPVLVMRLGGGCPNLSNPRYDVSISGLTITGGSDSPFSAFSPVSGAGIFDCEKLTLTGVVLTHNTARGAAGALQVKNGASVTMDRSTVSANAEGGMPGSSVSGSPGGGGILVEAGGTLTLTNSTVSANTAGGPGLGFGEGGAILNQGTASLTNDTVSDNSAAADGSSGFGGGIFTLDAAATTTIVNSTIANNHAGGAGSSVACGGNLLTSQTCAGGPDGRVNLKNTIASGGTGTSGQENCAGAGYVSQGHNLETTNQCKLSGAGDLVNTDPKLGPLSDNGGPTQTRALATGSPAINTADNSGCPSADQRGITRPQAGICDIGAFELVFQNDLMVTKSAPSQITLGSNLTSTITVTNNGPQPADGVTVQDSFSAAAPFISIASLGQCSGNPLFCSLGSLAPGASETVTVVNRPSKVGTFQDAAVVSGAYADPNPANNTATASTQVVASKPTLSLRVRGISGAGCRSTDSVLRVDVTPPGSTRVISVRLDRRALARRRGSSLRKRIPIRRLRTGRHHLVITVIGNQGQTTRRTIAFRRCPRPHPRFTG